MVGEEYGLGPLRTRAGEAEGRPRSGACDLVTEAPVDTMAKKATEITAISAYAWASLRYPTGSRSTTAFRWEETQVSTAR